VQKAIVLFAASVGLLMATYWIAFAQGPENETDAQQIIDVSAKKYEFSPSEIHVQKGARVELKVHSEDDTHGVKLDVYPEGTTDKGAPGLLFDQPSQNGKVKKQVDQVIDFVAQEPGTYNFKCAKLCGLGHDRMKGKLVVDP
jgi:cytochrome c oxidase subunit II